MPRAPSAAHRLPELRPVRSAPGSSPGARGLSRLHHQLNELGVHVDTQLVELAFTHRSYAYENGGIPTNERLEFLGDAVLQIIVTDYLYLTFPDLPEGRLAKLRAAVVSSAALAEIARELEIGSAIKLGKGEIATGGHDKTSILADALEAIIGAIYLSSGMGAAETFVRHNTVARLQAAATLGARLDPKTELQEFCAAQGSEQPHYLVTEAGPDHDKIFTAEAVADGRVLGTGTGTSKRQAEQHAAAQAVEALRA